MDILLLAIFICVYVGTFSKVLSECMENLIILLSFVWVHEELSFDKQEEKSSELCCVQVFILFLSMEPVVLLWLGFPLSELFQTFMITTS